MAGGAYPHTYIDTGAPAYVNAHTGSPTTQTNKVHTRCLGRRRYLWCLSAVPAGHVSAREGSHTRQPIQRVAG
jgi:hypothetical protein